MKRVGKYAIKKIKPYMETRTGIELQKALLNEAIKSKLQIQNSNETNVKKFKKNLKNVYNVYKYRKANNFNKGRYVGKKFTNALFEFYESQANKKRFTNDNAFTKGLKNGMRERIVFWIPGSFTRGLLRGFQYDTGKFMKRAQNVKGVENIHKLFSGNNTNAYSRRRTTPSR